MRAGLKSAPKPASKKAVGKKQTSANAGATTKKPQPERPKRGTAAGQRGKVELISSELAYRGPLFDVYKDFVREPEGMVSRRDVIRHSGSVVILAVDGARDADGPLIVVERQYRHAAGQYMWEIPAGRKEPGETPLAGAKRELLEETGYRARRWKRLMRFYVSPGFLGEWMELYLAEDLTLGDAKPDEDEFIEHRQISLSQALEWVAAGKIIDAKTIIAILLCRQMHSSARSGSNGSTQRIGK